MKGAKGQLGNRLEKSSPPGHMRQPESNGLQLGLSKSPTLLYAAPSWCCTEASDRSAHAPPFKMERKFPGDLLRLPFPKALIKADQLHNYSTSSLLLINPKQFPAGTAPAVVTRTFLQSLSLQMAHRPQGTQGGDTDTALSLSSP